MSAAACEFIAHLFERFALHGRTKAGGEGKGGEMRDAMSRKAVKGGLDWMISSLPDVRPGSYGLARWRHGRWKAGVEGLRDGNGLISGFTLSCSGRLWAGPLARLGTWHPPRPLAILGNRISRRPRAPRLATARLISKRPRPCIPHAPPPLLAVHVQPGRVVLFHLALSAVATRDLISAPHLSQPYHSLSRSGTSPRGRSMNEHTSIAASTLVD